MRTRYRRAAPPRLSSDNQACPPRHVLPAFPLQRLITGRSRNLIRQGGMGNAILPFRSPVSPEWLSTQVSAPQTTQPRTVLSRTEQLLAKRDWATGRSETAFTASLVVQHSTLCHHTEETVTLMAMSTIAGAPPNYRRLGRNNPSSLHIGWNGNCKYTKDVRKVSSKTKWRRTTPATATMNGKERLRR